MQFFLHGGIQWYSSASYALSCQMLSAALSIGLKELWIINENIRYLMPCQHHLSLILWSNIIGGLTFREILAECNKWILTSFVFDRNFLKYYVKFFDIGVWIFFQIHCTLVNTSEVIFWTINNLIHLYMTQFFAYSRCVVYKLVNTVV